MLRSLGPYQQACFRVLGMAMLLAAGQGSLDRAASADERLFGIACRSVHWGYPTPKGDAFFNEVAIKSSAPGTFFMVCGWDQGYFGLQELGDGKKLLIFSVWDPGVGDDPNAVPDEVRVKLAHRDPEVRVGRFGGEGTGGQSFLDFDWKLDTTYQFAVRAQVEGEWTRYEGHFFDPEKNQWRHLVTFASKTGGRSLGGCYSFVEDFKRDRRSPNLTRRALFGIPWFRGDSGEWQVIDRARFTADANPDKRIDAAVVDGRFSLATGGDIRNEGVPLGQQTTLSELPQSPPAALELLFSERHP